MEDSLYEEEYTMNDLYSDLKVQDEVYFTLRFTMYVVWTTEDTYTIINLFDGTRSPRFESLDRLMAYKLNNNLSLYNNWDEFHLRFLHS